MIRRDWANLGAAQQPLSFFGGATGGGSNGFDFGMSQPKTGFGYGLLGDTRTLQQSQACLDCPPSDPCPNCSGDSDSNPRGQIIKVQAPMPMPLPGMTPPPIGLLPQKPPGHVVIGDPNAWWNWTPGEVGDWARGVFEARRPTKNVDQICEDLLFADFRRCEAIARKTTAEAGPERGARELDSCYKHSKMRNAECLANNGTPKSPPYPDWYEDPPYPDDFENPYPD